MNAGLDIYRKQIHERIKEVSAAFIFSLEQKSPHAFVDAELAKNSNTPSAQIQCCQQAFFDIPNPVCADYFLCETPKVKNRFRDSWATHINRLKYIGSFQGIGAEQKLQVSRKNSDILRICLFLGLEKISNSALLKDFSEFAHLNKVKLLVKLHPRDSQRYSSVCSDVTYFTSYQDGFLEFSRTFDVAITFPSGVISDLVYSEVPFLVYVPQYKEYQITEAEYLPDGLEPMTSIESIFDKLKDMDELVRNQQFILANFRKANGIVTNIESIELSLKNLIVERKLMYEGEI